MANSALTGGIVLLFCSLEGRLLPLANQLPLVGSSWQQHSKAPAVWQVAKCKQVQVTAQVAARKVVHKLARG